MLPFLANTKNKSIAGTIIAKRKEDGSIGQDSGPDYDSEGLEACANDLLQAIESKDSKAIASALKAAFEICDSQSHEEGPHLNEDQSENE